MVILWGSDFCESPVTVEDMWVEFIFLLKCDDDHAVKAAHPAIIVYKPDYNFHKNSNPTFFF